MNKSGIFNNRRRSQAQNMGKWPHLSLRRASKDRKLRKNRFFSSQAATRPPFHEELRRKWKICGVTCRFSHPVSEREAARFAAFATRAFTSVDRPPEH